MADYFSFQRRRNNSLTRDRLNAPLPPSQEPMRRTPLAEPGSMENLRRNPASSIRIRRLPSGDIQQQARSGNATNLVAGDTSATGRRRSFSDPHRYASGGLAPPATDLSQQRTTDAADYHMPTITEGQQSQQGPTQTPGETFHEAVETPYQTPMPPTPGVSEYDAATQGPASRIATGASTMDKAGNAARENRGLRKVRTTATLRDRDAHARGEYTSDVVDLLDLVDPQVRTLGTLTNVQNSLFVPDLGSLINRRPTYNLTQTRTAESRPQSSGIRTNAQGVAERPSGHTLRSSRPSRHTLRSSHPPGSDKPEGEDQQQGDDIEMSPVHRRLSISSNLSDSRYAVLPHGISLEGWSEEDKAELDDYVRHLMHSRRESFKRSWRGFKQYVSKPLGLFVTVYATLVTLFGAAWVFFLIGWIYVGSRQDYFINVIDNILVALFALMGDGLAPFRAVDTYHMCFIARYHHMTWRLRKERALPELVDHNDLPDRRASFVDPEDQIDKEEMAEFSVLKPIQQKRLQYHQAKFAKAHTFYRPHETSTHHAFPLRLLVAVVVLLDFHSIFQVALGTCTWSIPVHTRPEALTATILCCSLTCNITAGIIISIGDHRTRKKDVLERIHRQELTTEALGRMQKKHRDEPLGDDIQEELRKKSLADAERVHTPPEHQAVPAIIEPSQRKSQEARRSMEVRRKSYEARKSMEARRSYEARRSLDAKREIN